MGPTVPNTYQFPIQFEAVDTYTDDSESPDPEDNQSPADARDMALLRQDNRGSKRTSPQRPPDSLQTMPQTIAPPLPSASTMPPPPVTVVSPAVPVTSSNRSRAKKSKACDSLVILHTTRLPCLCRLIVLDFLVLWMHCSINLPPWNSSLSKSILTSNNFLRTFTNHFRNGLSR